MAGGKFRSTTTRELEIFTTAGAPRATASAYEAPALATGRVGSAAAGLGEVLVGLSGTIAAVGAGAGLSQEGCK